MIENKNIKNKIEGNGEVMPDITIIDAPCGKGKTQLAIQHMNEADMDNRFIYITPFLNEVERIKLNCTRQMFEPNNKNSKGSKLESLKKLVSQGKDIVSTHALFHDIDKELISLIKSGGYTLILDEVMDVVQLHYITVCDWEGLVSKDRFKVLNDGKIEWLDDNYKGDFNWVMNYAKSDNLYMHSRNGEDTGTIQLLVWTFPTQSFTCFEDVYILTYMFHAQIQRYYFDMYNLKYIMKSVHSDDSKYMIIDYDKKSEEIYRNSYKELINIYEGRLNFIGDDDYSISSTWLKTKTTKVKLLKNNTYNYFNNILKSSSKDNMWTTIKGVDGSSNGKSDEKVRKALSGNGYSRGFVPCTARATNDYVDKTCCAYLLNRFQNPMITGFFTDKGIIIDEDLWATSELIQWLFRSAVRQNKPINLYIPSMRMRKLLTKWLGC